METIGVLHTIDTLYETYLSFWEDICNLESPTNDKAGVDAVGEYVAAWAKARGWQVEILEHPVAGNALCITMNPHVKKAPLSVSGHMDTVHARGTFGTPAVRRDREKIYGPGVTDCKGGIVAACLAMDALHRCGFEGRPVQLLLQSDEEVGSSASNRATIHYICEKAKDSVAFLNLEGATRGEACLVRKGIVNFTFTVTGKEAHASNCAEAGANAILEAAHKIIEMEKLKDPEGLTCNCGVIRGGTVPNTVPGFCEFKANVRFATREQLAWVREYARKVAETVVVSGCSCTVTEARCRVAMEYSERNVALLETMNRIFVNNHMSELRMSKRKGGSDAAEVTECGIPCVDSMGVEGGRIHSSEEYAYVESLREAAKRIAAIACEI